MASIKEGLLELKDLVNTVLLRKIDFESKIINDGYSFKQKEREYYGREIEKLIKKNEAILSESFIIAPNDKRALMEVSVMMKDLKKMINEHRFLEATVEIEKINGISPSVDIDEAELPKSEFQLPYVPKVIFSETKASFDELIKCYEHSCYRSSLILCGRILEIAMHAKYFEATGYDLLEKSPDIGLGNLVMRFNEKEIPLDPGLSNQIHLINQLRIASVHKKKQVFNPTKNQTQATILYTLDTVKKLFSRS